MSKSDASPSRRSQPTRSRAPWLMGAAVLIGLVALAVVVSSGRVGPLPDSGDVSSRQARQLIERGIRVVDVRTPEEFEGAHIPGAENVPFDAVVSAAAAWDKGDPVLLYCATGERSASAYEALKRSGFLHVYNLKGGIVAWDGDVTSGTATRTAGGIGPLPSGRPALYEFYTDW